MELDFLAWANLGVRWLHFIAGIAWIGASFYFVWLDNSLRPAVTQKPGVAGELWAVHGGGFYHNEKFLTAPPELPKELHWFKWEAYTTWLSGFALMILVYYMGADLYLIDRSKMAFSQGAAIAIGLGVLVAGWFVYDLLCRSPLGKDQKVFGVIWFLLLTAATYALTQIFTDRGAFIHIGAIIGTAMVANVFFVIIPNQTKTVAAMVAGETPDPALGVMAKQRSVHNNYMTLPVLLIMISNHYPMLVGHQLNWLLLAGIGAASVMVRHFFNLRHRGMEKPALLAGGALVMALTLGVASIKPPQAGAAVADRAGVSEDAVMQIVDTHCAACHAAEPSHPAFSAPQGGLVLESVGDVRAASDAILLQAVNNQLMPLGNETGMTADERATLGAWIAQQENR